MRLPNVTSLLLSMPCPPQESSLTWPCTVSGCGAVSGPSGLWTRKTGVIRERRVRAGGPPRPARWTLGFSQGQTPWRRATPAVAAADRTLTHAHAHTHMHSQMQTHTLRNPIGQGARSSIRTSTRMVGRMWSRNRKCQALTFELCERCDSEDSVLRLVSHLS